MIEFRGLTKRFGSRLALDDVSFAVEPGRVTAFLGPNGAGKTTSMRILLGLERPTSGVALIDGHEFATIRAPMLRVGALLDARNAHPGRTAFNHLKALALTHGLPESRVEEVLEAVGLGAVAGGRVGGFSLGMRQRLGIAGALLGDPATLIFDEPVNGLDPEGVRWFRDLARALADDGRTVFLSSHLISEVALTADQVVVIGRGRVLANASLEEMAAMGSETLVVARSARPTELADAVRSLGHRVEFDGERVTVAGISAAAVGELAAESGIALHELRTKRPSLEDAYRRLTDAEVEFGER